MTGSKHSPWQQGADLKVHSYFGQVSLPRRKDHMTTEGTVTLTMYSDTVAVSHTLSRQRSTYIVLHTSTHKYSIYGCFLQFQTARKLHNQREVAAEGDRTKTGKEC